MKVPTYKCNKSRIPTFRSTYASVLYNRDFIFQNIDDEYDDIPRYNKERVSVDCTLIVTWHLCELLYVPRSVDN